ncbi:TPA: hypothetical protein RQL04_003594, partial [Vibrio vulnificus]|nr:hypothetical protein [Vibrio vulnificus]
MNLLKSQNLTNSHIILILYSIFEEYKMLNAHIRFVSFLILLSGLLFSGNALPQEENSEQETNPPSTIVIGITSKSINPSLDSESLGVYWGVNVEYLRNIAKILNIN